MKVRAISAALLISAAAISAAHAQSRTKAHVTTLASDATEGRLTGSAGERLAGDYLVAELKKIGARPLPGAADFRLPFEFTAGSKDGGTTISITKISMMKGTTGGFTTNARTKVQALSFSDNADVTAPIVFAGYGIVVPSGQTSAALTQGYDSYAGLDVTDKIVVVLRYFPEDAETATKQILARYSDLRYKAMAARQRGAKALLVVAGPRSPNAGEIIPMTFDTALAGSGIAAASISGDVARELFAAADQNLEDVQEALDSANPHATGFAIPDVTVTLHTAVVREKQTGHNIAAYLPATDVAPAARPWIALGAHYDHLGRGTHGNSLAPKEEAGLIHFGADDNASGSAAVLSVGDILSRQPRRRHVLLAFWSGEEIGLVGSAAFVARPPVAADQIAAYLNFDMVGRMQDNKLAVQAMGTSPVWARIVEQANISAGFDLQPQQDPYQPTDVATFNQAEVPSLSFFTGTHTDYHRPTDTSDKIEYDDLDRIVVFAAGIVRRLDELADAPQFTKVEQIQSGAGRAGVRVFTGTIPDYATEVKGLLLGGVIGGGPAEQAGLRKGDVIVEIAGQTIANIYDYTYALEVLKIGVPVKIAYMRDGKRIETTLTPGARK